MAGGDARSSGRAELVDVTIGLRVVREEIFGPVVCVQSFDDDSLDAVAKFANDTEYGLQASNWTGNLRVAYTLARKIKAGTICVNAHNNGDPARPFAGFKGAGWDRTGHSAAKPARLSAGLLPPESGNAHLGAKRAEDVTNGRAYWLDAVYFIGHNEMIRDP